VVGSPRKLCGTPSVACVGVARFGGRTAGDRPGSRWDSSRPASPASLIASWQDASVHIWGWDGVTTMPSPVLFRAIRMAPWAVPPMMMSALSSVTVRTAGGETMRPMSMRLDWLGAPKWLSGADMGAGPMTSASTSDSVRWFAAVARVAAGVVRAGAVSPAVVESAHGPLAEAVWEPALGPVVLDAVAALNEAMPPIAMLDQSSDPAMDVFASFADALSRGRLLDRGWAPTVPRDRAPTTAMLKTTFRALSSLDRRVPVTKPGEDDALGWIATAFDRAGRRADGGPVVTPRLRLVVPDDRLEPWTVVLEVVDEADRGKWCTAADVWERTPLAIDVAGDERHLPLLNEAVWALAIDASDVVDVLRPLGDAKQPSDIELDVEAAAEFLDLAPDALARVGIDLIGPEHLVRSRVSIRGEATPAPPSDRSGGFNRDTIVKWSFTVADPEGTTAISDAELARAEATGATLLHTGHRWVRIDPDAIRRARKRMTEYVDQAEHAEALALLRIAADAAAAGDELGTDASFSDPAVVDPGDDDRARYAEWSGRLLGGLPDDELKEEHESERFTGELRHYQRRGLGWMRFLSRLGLGGCLADDMGLGKTATTLAHLVERPGRHLVVCPLSVVHNWETEAARFTPSLAVTVHHGSARSLGNGSDDQGAFDLGQPHPDRELVVTTYGLLARDIEHLSMTEWATVVLDEAQFVKNPNTKSARAVRRLRAGQRLALTGTPVENRLSELWSILDGVNPGMLGSREKFRHRFSKPIERGDDPALAAEAATHLRTLTRPFVLRRTKADRSLVPDLPDKIEQIAYAGLTREQALLYQKVVDELLEDAKAAQGMKRRGLILAALTKLKQICNHPMNALGDTGRIAGRSGKLARFDELVDELVEVGERALVFTQYVDMGGILQRHLADRFGWQTPFLHGGVARKQRTDMIAAFQDPATTTGERPPLLIVSLKAGGTGLNLTAASQVIHYDRWWNPAVENQATDRAWRLGQKRTVLVHKLVCEGTVEERIDKLISDKQALADVVVGSGESWLSELSTSDLQELVQLDVDLGALPGRTDPEVAQ
jgi:SNF2 family DNA or RNA helicase